MHNEIHIPSQRRSSKTKSPIQWETEKKKTLENQSAKANTIQESLRKGRANAGPKGGKGVDPRSPSHPLPKAASERRVMRLREMVSNVE